MGSQRIYPPLDRLDELHSTPSEAEIALARFLDNQLPHGWEIFLKPKINFSRPNIVIFNPQSGLMFFECVDKKPEEFKLIEGSKRSKNGISDFDFFMHVEDGLPILNPIEKLIRHRRDVIEIYIPEIAEILSKEFKFIKLIKLGLYFHNSTTEIAQKYFPIPKNRCTVFGRDAFEVGNRYKVVPSFYRDYYRYFTDSILQSITDLLKPPTHEANISEGITLTKEQRQHANPAPKVHQRLRGGAGSGKSLVIAHRAANIASKGRSVLIVTFNITLCNYLRSLMQKTMISFDMGLVEIIHFHGFCRNIMLDNYHPWPKDRTGTDFWRDEVPSIVKKLIDKSKTDNHRKYDAVLIDEGQDFNKNWYDVLTQVLTENNELLLAADKKQNVYRIDLSWISRGMKGTQFRGPWRELKTGKRIPRLIAEQANKFAEIFLPECDTEPIHEDPQTSLQFEPHIIWRNVAGIDDAISGSIKAIKWLLYKKYKPGDIVCLTHKHSDGIKLVELLEKSNIEVNHIFSADGPKKRLKRSFVVGDDRVLACTIHSFKGWESQNVIIIPPYAQQSSGINTEEDYLMYTAMTRTMANLIVFNINPKYNSYGEGWPNTEEWLTT
jgi:hypothetical protein